MLRLRNKSLKERLKSCQEMLELFKKLHRRRDVVTIKSDDEDDNDDNDEMDELGGLDPFTTFDVRSRKLGQNHGKLLAKRN